MKNEKRVEIFTALTKFQLALHEFHDNEQVINVVKAQTSQSSFNEFKHALDVIANTIFIVEQRV